METFYLVRHGASLANKAHSEAYGSRDATLQYPDGVAHALEAERVLIYEHELDPDTPTAASYLRRSGDTALIAGFTPTAQYHELDEVTLPTDMTRDRYHDHKERWKREGFDEHIDAYILDHARAALARNIQEKILFTHGLTIAGICNVLGQHREKSVIPQFGEVRKITLD